MARRQVCAHSSDRAHYEDLERESWYSSPGTAVIADFEYCSRLLSRLKHHAIFEVALSNAEGKWVVPPTTINHSMPVGELANLIYSAGRQYGLNAEQMGINLHSVKKFYPRADWSRETEGSTWAEIAQKIETYVEVLPLNF